MLRCLPAIPGPFEELSAETKSSNAEYKKKKYRYHWRKSPNLYTKGKS